MKLILATESKKIYFHPFKGGNLIIIHTFQGHELVYTYAEAVRLGIVQTHNHERVIVGTSWFYNMPSITEYRRF